MNDEKSIDEKARVAELASADSQVLDRLGITVKSVERGRVELEMPIETSMTNSHGVCHGAFLFGLADTAFAYTLSSVGISPVTLQATISFLRAAKVGETVSVIGEVSRAGRKAVFATCKVYNQRDQMIAEFQGSGFNV